MQPIKALSALGLCLLLFACNSNTTQIYSLASSSARMTVEQSVDVGSFSNGSVKVTLSRFIENCKSEFLGQISESDLKTGFGLPAGQKLVLGVTVARKRLSSTGSLSEQRVFETRAGSSYRLKLVYDKSGYIVDIYENGRKLPFERPCTY